MAASFNRLTTIYRENMHCVKCSARIPKGAPATWTTGANKGFICVSCANISSEDVEAYKARKANPAPVPESDLNPAEAHPSNGNGHINNDALGAFAGLLAPYLDSKLRAKVDESRVLDLIEQAINSSAFMRIEVHSGDAKLGEIKGAIHPVVPQAIELLSLGLNVYIYGPPGAGKTHCAQQIADAFDVELVPFQMSKLSPESSIKGFTDAAGHLQEQAFIEAVSKPCLMFLDELDRWPAHLVTLLNSLLANGYIVARGHEQPIRRHERCYILAAGNTTMRGRDEYFPEAQALEFSTIDRFVYLHVGYDEALEEKIALALNPNAKPWVLWVRSIRPAAMSGKYGKILATPRAVYDGAKILARTKLSIDTVADAVCFKGIDSATRNQVLTANPLPRASMGVN